MVGEQPPEDVPAEASPDLPRRARRAADPEPSPVPAVTPAEAPAADADETTVLPRTGSRSRAAREARAAASSAGGATAKGSSPTGRSPQQPSAKRRSEKERRRLAKEREKVRRETASDRGVALAPGATGVRAWWSRVTAPLPGSPGLIAAVVGVVVLALVVTFTALAVRRDTTAGPSSNGSTGTTVDESRATTALLTADSMLTVDDAKTLAADRTWKIALDQKGRDDSSPSAACVASSPPEGQPQPQQLQVRTLAASGAGSLAALHQAQSYATKEEAIQAFTLIVKAFGDCLLPKAHISSGSTVSGVGDQVVALTFTIAEATPQYRTVLVNRTGRVINIVDVAQNDKPVAVGNVLKALGQVTDTQCTAAVGLCSGVLKVSDGPPPLGGDEPGFLAVADLPPPADGDTAGDGQWNALPTATPAATSSTGCEGVDLTATPARSRVARTYLWSKTPAQSPFGLDDIVLTLDSEKAATELAKKIVTNLRDCKKRQPTAATSSFDDVSGVGAQRSTVTGTIAAVRQKTTDATLEYRVAVVTAGAKVIFLFLPTEKSLDLSTEEWTTLAVRAGQRATQIQ